eukprot:scaffold20341_cov65-Isochrysis_galbana.AAC.1
MQNSSAHTGCSVWCRTADLARWSETRGGGEALRREGRENCSVRTRVGRTGGVAYRAERRGRVCVGRERGWGGIRTRLHGPGVGRQTLHFGPRKRAWERVCARAEKVKQGGRVPGHHQKRAPPTERRNGLRPKHKKTKRVGSRTSDGENDEWIGVAGQVCGGKSLRA